MARFGTVSKDVGSWWQFGGRTTQVVAGHESTRQIHRSATMSQLFSGRRSGVHKMSHFVASKKDPSRDGFRFPPGG